MDILKFKRDQYDANNNNRCIGKKHVGEAFLGAACEENSFEADSLEVPVAQDIHHIEDLSNVNNILVVAGPSRTSLDKGERILDKRLADEHFIRSPGQIYTPRDRN